MAKSPDLFSPALVESRAVAPSLRADARDADEHEVLSALLAEIRRFCSKEVDGAAIDQRGALGEPLLSAVAERGLFGLTVPERYGGAGLSIKAACRVTAELAGYNGSLGTCIGLHSGLALYSLIHLANEGLRERYLPDVAEGKRIAAFAATEPGAGSDLSAMSTTLSEAADGTLHLSGTKCYVTNGGLCGVLTTVARSPGLGGARAGHTVVVLDPNWPGIVRHGEEKKLGLKGSSTITIDYDDVVVPRTHVVGEASLGMEYAHRALTWGRTFMAAGCLGPARAAVAQAEEHAAVRVQFGRPLLRFPLVRHTLAAAKADVFAAESIIRLVCHGFDSEMFDIGLPSTAAKVFVSETAWHVVDSCLQLLGGLGYMEEANMARRLRDLRVTRIFEGANDVLRLHLAAATLGWPSDPLSSCPSLSSLAPPALEGTLAAVDRAVADALALVTETRKKHGFRLFDRQILQSHMADALIHAYAAVACGVRCSGLASSVVDAADEATAALAIERLCQRVHAAIDAARASDDDRERIRADTILGGT
jgi:alkylation response protein AidB-like acyl-CoA dehydrogenase